MNTVIVAPSVKNVMQKVNEWGNANSGLIATVGLVATALLLLKRMR